MFKRNVRDDGASVGCGCKGSEGGFEAGGVFDVRGGKSFVDLAVEAGEDFAGADFNELSGAGFGEELDALDPADRRGDLADESVADFGAAGEEASVGVGGDGEGGVVEDDGFEGVGEGILRGLHERGVEGAADGEHDGALGAGFFATRGGEFNGGGGA